MSLPKSFRNFAEFEREVLYTERRIGLSLEEMVEDNAFDAEIEVRRHGSEMADQPVVLIQSLPTPGSRVPQRWAFFIPFALSVTRERLYPRQQATTNNHARGACARRQRNLKFLRALRPLDGQGWAWRDHGCCRRVSCGYRLWSEPKASDSRFSTRTIESRHPRLLRCQCKSPREACAVVLEVSVEIPDEK